MAQHESKQEIKHYFSSPWKLIFKAYTVYDYIKEEIIDKGYFLDIMIKDGNNYTFIVHKLSQE